jgi:hypothetical protein
MCTGEALGITAYILKQIESAGTTASQGEMKAFTQDLLNQTDADACRREVGINARFTNWFSIKNT